MRKLLRNPEFGNSWRLNNRTIFHRNMSGELRTSGILDRPILESFNVVIKWLTSDQIDAFKNYVLSTAGQEVSMVDFEGTNWTGVITNQDLNITKEHLKADCRFSVSFSFEGMKS